MATCPECKAEWKWDFQQDIYRHPMRGNKAKNRGRMCKSAEFKLELGGEGDAGEITVYQCDCGKVLGIMNALGSVDCIAEWKEIDWDTEEHSF